MITEDEFHKKLVFRSHLKQASHQLLTFTTDIIVQYDRGNYTVENSVIYFLNKEHFKDT